MAVVGVTGTNGKTTTTYLLEAVFRAAGLAPGVIGTTGVPDRRRGRAVRPHHAGGARPPAAARADARRRRRAPSRWRSRRTALDQHRVDGVAVRRARCSPTSSQDHLDYHGDHGGVLRGEGAPVHPGAVRARGVDERRRSGRPAAPRGATDPHDRRSARSRAGHPRDGRRSIRRQASRSGSGRPREVRSAAFAALNVSNCLGAFAAAHAGGDRTPRSRPGDRRGRRACRGGWSRSRRARTSWWSSTTPTRRIASRTCCGRPARCAGPDG